MRLLSYKMITGPSATAMDSYYNIMFRKELPYVDRTGKITNDNMSYMNRANLSLILGQLSKEQAGVTWEIVVQSKGRYHKYIANGGEVARLNVRPDNDGGD
jgi:hypothetical protein